MIDDIADIVDIAADIGGNCSGNQEKEKGKGTAGSGGRGTEESGQGTPAVTGERYELYYVFGIRLPA